ncbi:MAG: sugar phosphate nucleotidyltransferase [Patescibacteria group bacterium]|jgi:NDP-sugar pyrophosphorylase family protein
MIKKVGKDRLTITMSEDVLSKLDKYIDGDKIRNRSHAIEYIVSHHLGTDVSTCVILAGGSPDQSIKPLLRIKNRPIIAYTIELLRQANIRNIIMVINSDNQDIKKYLGDGSQWKVAITYIEDKSGQGTAVALKLAQQYITGSFLLLYGDVLVNIDLQEFIQYHKALDRVAATLAVTACTNPSHYGVTELQGHYILRLIEKPASYNKSNLVFAGLAICEPQLFDYLLQPEKRSDLTRDILPDLAHRGQIAGYPFSGKWFDVSYPEEYERARQEWI